jgi:ABC-type oligopeptide transport system substrate-binding subunit
VVPFLKESWHRHLGLSLESREVEWEVLAELRNSNPPNLALVGWSADYPDPDSFLRASIARRCARWHNPAYERLVEEAARVTDHARRIELYQKADRILVAEEAVILPLTYVQGRVLVKPWVSLPRTPPSLMRFKDLVVGQKGGDSAKSR